jgi:N-acetyl-gamma-glutamyl-phosphate reductase
VQPKKQTIAILGASGYTGAELLRLALTHPYITIGALTADRAAGKPIASLFPQFRPYNLPQLVRVEEVAWQAIDAVFCCLPHGTTQALLAELYHRYTHLKFIDLSADFRLQDPQIYQHWYGTSHKAPDLQPQAVYGLSELARPLIAKARLVANPGCYPTAIQLPLVPLLKAGLIEGEEIIIDAKSGVSGAGRSAKEANLYSEVTEGLHPYGVGQHRHLPEIEQQLSLAAKKAIKVSFTPHLMPMSRGMLASLYVRLRPNVGVGELLQSWQAHYKGEPFISLCPPGEAPQTRHVRASNQALLAAFADQLPGRAILFCAIDNLTKGASGQALQNLNILYGWDEQLGLSQVGVFP